MSVLLATFHVYLLCRQGRLRGKKLQSLIDRILPPSDLGPYAGGSYTSPSGLSATLELVPLSRLQSGVNAERVIVGRTVCSLCMESAVALYVANSLYSYLAVTIAAHIVFYLSG